MAILARRTPARDAKFFASLQSGAPITVACREAGYQRSATYRWRKDDTDFVTRWNEAQDIAADLLEEEADRRARDGYDEVTTRDGVETIRNKRSDMLLLARLKAMRPERYREGGAAQGSKTVTIEIVVRNHLKELAERLAAQGIAPQDMNLTEQEN